MRCQRIAVAVAALALSAAGCRGNTPISVADRFVGRYYVEYNHAGARALAVDAAAARLEREMTLLIEARRGPGPGQPHPRVELERVGEPEEQRGDVRITYKLTSHVPAGPPITRHVVVELRKAGTDWRVHRFTEAG
jgi:hypothetical protein